MEETLKQQPSACLKIVLFGPESTGKTTLAKELANFFNTEWVPEFMREYLQNKWDETGENVKKSDLIPIAEGQLRLENKLSKIATDYLFCDTDLLELKVYSEYYYDGFCPVEILQSIEESHYDYYLLMDVDIPWKKDDLRDLPHDRLGIFRTFERELKKRQLPYKVISGNRKERLDQAIATIKNLG